MKQFQINEDVVARRLPSRSRLTLSPAFACMRLAAYFSYVSVEQPLDYQEIKNYHLLFLLL